MPNPAELLRSRSYVMLVLFGAIIGVPVAAVSYFFLKLVAETQQYVFDTLPGELGFDSQPSWWSIPFLALSGLIVAASIRYLPGTSGHKPAEGFKTGGPVQPIELPGIILASFATLSLGVVLGPEAPLIAIGSGMGVLAVHLIKRDAPADGERRDRRRRELRRDLDAARLPDRRCIPDDGGRRARRRADGDGARARAARRRHRVADLHRPRRVDGLRDVLARRAGHSTGGKPDRSEFLWAIAIGILAAFLGTAIRRLALALQPIVAGRSLVLTPLAGVGIGVLVLIFVEATDKPSAYVLFSGQDQLPGLIEGAATWSVGALILLAACKGLAYSLALSGFRGGPVFPGMFVGAVVGIALSHLPGLPMIAGAAMGIGAMTVAMLGLPLVSLLLVVLFLQADSVQLTPLVIVAIVVSYIVSARLNPVPVPEAAPSTRAARAGSVVTRTCESMTR